MNWITQDGNKAQRFIVDADLAYEKVVPEVMETLAVDSIDQYVLEIAHTFIKLDARVHVGANYKIPQGVFMELKICGSEGYKERWGWRNYPEGKYAGLRQENEQEFAKRCAADARAVYKQARGYYPA